MDSKKVQYITHPIDGCSYREQTADVCRAGIKWVQFRMKDKPNDQLLDIAKEVQQECKAHNAIFIVNDSVEMTKELNADGVHLGLSDMNPLEARKILGADAIIGATCNSMDDIRVRSKQQVDYIGVGPFRHTDTKKLLSPILGIDGFKDIIAQCKTEGINIPIVAIGGIREDDITELLKIGVYGIAISSLITKSENRIEAGSAIVKKIEKLETV